MILKQKIHPALKYLHDLQNHKPSMRLDEILSSFVASKSIDEQTFIEGIKKFIQLANSNPIAKNSELGREALYGNVYSGLHYSNDLAKLWNSKHSSEESVERRQVARLAPSEWDYVDQDTYLVLIYKGRQPAQALDILVKGPTVIDCGMFAQLSIWFGLRYMLGNERFNQCFGRATFFINQLVYNDIEACNKPYSGNPLYSFLSTKQHAPAASVTVKHIQNNPLYRYKHPGENYGGENSILIDQQHYIFDPHLEGAQQSITESALLNLLHESFNKPRTQEDLDFLAVYTDNPEEIHPAFLLNGSQFLTIAESLADKQLSKEEFLSVEQNSALELRFDMLKFSAWLKRMENQIEPGHSRYVPKAIDSAQVPTELLNVIPFENKHSMDFNKFLQNTPQQQNLMGICKDFCHSLMNNESKLVILTGKAGVGKTASAVCAAKELAIRGKQVVWISEVMVKGWADQAKSFADLDKCNSEIDRMLAKDPDVVFLDDDNLGGYSGQLLLEKFYSWYVNNPGKGLFITSNEPIDFANCYGYRLNRTYHYPPFSKYNSSQYLNWQHTTNLAGESLRIRRDGQSIGAIVSDSVWKAHEGGLKDVALIPSFESDELSAINRALKITGSVKCSEYEKLRPVQKQWIIVRETVASYMFEYENKNGFKSYYEPSHLIANVTPFEQTTSKTIAVEIAEFTVLSVKHIYLDSMSQVIRVLNYAHDQGGRRVLLINKTSFTTEELLRYIEDNLPVTERERTWSRLKLLLCETEAGIFNYDQFNGTLETKIPEKLIDPKDDLISVDVADILARFTNESLRFFKTPQAQSSQASTEHAGQLDRQIMEVD